jgi:hypothetical protein
MTTIRLGPSKYTVPEMEGLTEIRLDRTYSVPRSEILVDCREWCVIDFVMNGHEELVVIVDANGEPCAHPINEKA